MGRHTVPGSGAPAPDRGFWVRVAVAAIAAVLILGFVATKLLGGGGDTSTNDAASPRTSASVVGPSGRPTDGSPPAPATVTSSPTRSTNPSPSPSSSRRPPTLSFRVLSPTYVTVRIPGGRTLVSKIFPAGATARYDQRVLEVVNGRPAGVRFLVNGTAHKPGPPDKTETFTARRG